MKRFALHCLLLLAAAPDLPAQDLPGDAAMRDLLRRQAEALEARFLPEVSSAADFEALRPRLREEYLHMLGLWPLPERTPLAAAVTGSLAFDGIAIENLHFQSRPGLYVTGNLYRPAGTGGRRLPAVLYVCGHSGAGKNGNKVQFQDHGIWLAKHGFVCLAIDTLQLGEIAAIHHGTYREGRWWWLSAGYTPAGVECWNGVRAIDYLQSRPEVDPERIGVTGISGGGAATFWIAAADERVRAAAPVSGMADLESYIVDQVVNGHCDCMFLHNTFRWHWTAIAALVCPRPLLFLNSDADPIFPMDANERVIAHLERLYARFGAGDRVDAVVSIGGHAYREDLRRAAFQFLGRHLAGDASPVTDADIGLPPAGQKEPLIPFASLRAFPADTDLPRDELNTRIDESFVPRRVPPPPAAGELERWRGELLGELRRVSFGGWPADASAVSTRDGAAPGTYVTATEPGIALEWGRLHAPDSSSRTTWALVLNPDEPSSKVPDWAQPLLGKDAVVLVEPRGQGKLRWTAKNPPNTVERSLMLLGQTADGGRIWDVRCVLQALALQGDRDVRVLGRGNAGVIAAYAALFESQVREVVAVEPPASHAPEARGAPYGPVILNVLRVLDVPDALGCLAPRPLRLIGAGRERFARTAVTYAAAGAEARLRWE